jgi:hypothetical protein
MKGKVDHTGGLMVFKMPNNQFRIEETGVYARCRIPYGVRGLRGVERRLYDCYMEKREGSSSADMTNIHRDLVKVSDCCA